MSNRTFETREEWLEHARKYASLKAGDGVTFADGKETISGIFLRFDDDGRAIVVYYDTDKDYGAMFTAPRNILFD